ncbi:MAG: DUF362 domain-containing protein [Candidatus Nanoarchaeia archaeon]|nr:DUF362 domain-containing protein [Candidatus Nanoarchaeia archaeon]
MVDVFITSCETYNQKEVNRAVGKILKNFKIKPKKTVLIKPNLLGSYRKGHIVITNPAVIEAICKVLAKNKNKIIIGDSSFQNTDIAIQKSGMLSVAKKYNAQVLNFEKTKLVNVKIPKGKILKEILLPEILFKADYIINVPKLKTHSLMKLTCAVKNLFGVIPGYKKQKLHGLAHSEKKFAQLLLDLHSVVTPTLTLVDAVIGMDGEGPSAGDARPTGIVFASQSSFAVDLVACDMIGWKRNYVPTNRLVMKQKLFNEPITIHGEMHHIPYKKPPALPVGLLSAVMRFMPKPKITVNKEKCIRCGACMRGCPVGAITLNPYPLINTKKCIRCFCCIEVCPEHALYLKDSFIVSLFNSLRKKNLKL